MEKDFTETPAMPSDKLQESLNETTPEETPVATAKETPAEPEANPQEPAKEIPAEEPVAKDDLDAVIAERESLKRRIDNQEKMIARFGTEVGLLRKRSPEEERVELERIRDVFIEDPVEGQKALDEYNKRKTNAETLSQEASQRQREVSNRTAILEHVPDFENTIDAISSILKEDGVPENSIEGFKTNPYILDHTTLFLLNKRAGLANELQTARTEIEQLKAENEKLKSKPEELVDKIEKAARQKPLTGKTSGAAPETPYGDKLVTQMSNEELQAQLRQ